MHIANESKPDEISQPALQISCAGDRNRRDNTPANSQASSAKAGIQGSCAISVTTSLEIIDGSSSAANDAGQKSAA